MKTFRVIDDIEEFDMVMESEELRELFQCHDDEVTIIRMIEALDIGNTLNLPDEDGEVTTHITRLT